MLINMQQLVAEAQVKTMQLMPPPIPFEASSNKKNRNDQGRKTDDDDSTQYLSYDFRIDSKDKNSEKVSRKFRIFDDGTPEEYCKWRIDYDSVASHPTLSKADVKYAFLVGILKGKSLDTFVTEHKTFKEYNSKQNVEDRLTADQLISLSLNKLAQNVFKVANAVRRQKHYMRNFLTLTGPVREFGKRLIDLNSYFPYFPTDDPEDEGLIKHAGLPIDELNDILDRAKPLTWHLTMLESNLDVQNMSWDEILEYYERLELSDAIKKAQDKGKSNGDSSHKRKRGKKPKDQSGSGNQSAKNKPASSRKEACKHCGKWHNVPDSDCWTLDKPPAKKQKVSFKGGSSKPKSEKSYMTKEEFSNMIAALPMFKNGTKVKKRKVTPDKEDNSISDSHSNHHSSDSSVSEYTNEYIYNVDRDRNKKLKTAHYTTEVIVEIKDRHGETVPIRCLLDTGTSATIILREYVAKGKKKGFKEPQLTKWSTMGGVFTTKRKALLEFKLPEFSTNKTVEWVCHVDETTTPEKAQYDMIVGTDLMTVMGLDIQFSCKKICWEDVEIPMKQRGTVNNDAIAQYLYNVAADTPLLREAENRQKRILDADYTAVDIDGFVATLSHLNDDEKRKLARTLNKHKRLFGGGLGTLSIKPIRLELQSDAKPYHARPFPVPQAFEGVTKKEIARLTLIGVLRKCHESEWAAPTFIQPKKTGDVRVLTDFRQLNKYLKRKPFPLPKISDLLQKLQGFTYATAIDLSMGYYHIPLDEFSQKLCTTILPWGKYQYQRLPMGIMNSPDIFQSIMMDVLGDLEYTRTYIDDILVTTSGSFEDHLGKLTEVLTRLENTGFKANVRKCYFAEDKLEYLGYWLTRAGIQPQPKKVEAILRLSPPTNKRQLRHFLGMINYYRDMWKRRSHYSAPLTGMVSKTAKFVWGAEQQQAFDRIKKVISRETLLAFPDFNKEFHIYTDASDYQLGAVIMQDDKPLAFYSRKLNAAQKRYTTGEQELLSIVETLKEFRNILLGQRIIVHTDHKNIVYGKLSNDRIARWRLLLEEYGPTYVHVKGTDNVVADALSRLDADFEAQMPSADSTMEMANAFSKEKDESFPMSPRLIEKHQKKDKSLNKKVINDTTKQYSVQPVEGLSLIHHNGKICIPNPLQKRIVAWYHEYLAHPGQTRLEATIRQLYTWPSLRAHVHEHCRTCDKCQLFKKQRKKYGHLPPKDAETMPWKRVNVDLIGPYKINLINDSKDTAPRELRALTMIDPVTGWFEIKAILKPDAATVMDAFHEAWLCRYPRPEQVGFDNGSEFKDVFSATCKNYGIKEKHSTSHNPQSNGVIERIHQVVGNSLRTFQLETKNLTDEDPWTPYLASVAWAVRSTYHTVLNATPGQLVFGRDMVLPIQFQADWARIKLRKQGTIDKSNAQENAKRIDHDYQVGDKVLLEKPGINRKMAQPRTGPFEIIKVHTNGTVRIRRNNVTERVNIRRLTPYFESSN
jgi:transposase InsO family protein